MFFKNKKSLAVLVRGVIVGCAAPLALYAAGATPAFAAASTCPGPVDRAAPVLSTGFGFNLSNTRNQVSSITASNVSRLGVGVSHAAAGASGKRGAPAVTEQAVFFSAGRRILAMDRRLGCEFWSYTVPNAGLGLTLGRNHVRSSSVLLVDEDPGRPALVIAGDARGYVYAINAVSGELEWSRFAGISGRYDWITGGMQVYRGHVYVPFSSREVILTAANLEPCCRTHGSLVSLDLYTGKTQWRYETTPRARFGTQRFKRTGVPTHGPSGAGIWGVPAIDPERGLLYIGTGQNYSKPVTETSDALIAIDLDTGKQRWAFQATKDDVWSAACEIPIVNAYKCPAPVGFDYDFGAPPVLARQPDGSDVVLGGDKGGVVWCLDADTGALKWSRRLGRGSALGGVHWGMATDQSKIYVAVADAFASKSALLFDGSGLNVPIKPVTGGTPGLYALDLQTGKPVWSVMPTHRYKGKTYASIYSAALSVTNDVMFAGALDGELTAFAVADGRELWRYDTDRPITDSTGNKGEGGTIDSVGAVPAGNTLLVNSGYDNFGGTDAYQAGTGNALLRFELGR